MKKMLALLMTFLLCGVLLSSCGKPRYAEKDFLGKSSIEIIAKYGEFDRKQGQPDAQGTYRDCACGYLVSEAKKGFGENTPPEYFMIYFDENGIANFCRYEQVV